jgi:hypothetical protein
MLKENKAHLTAISRKTLSQPMKHLVKEGLILDSALDYGCGRGQDADELCINAYDPYHRPDEDALVTNHYKTVTCNYVLNVIPEEHARHAVLNKIRDLLTDDGIAYVSVRNDVKALNGWTSKSTWQGLVLLDLPVVKKTSNFIMYKVTKND